MCRGTKKKAQNASGVTIGTGNDLAAADLNNHAGLCPPLKPRKCPNRRALFRKSPLMSVCASKLLLTFFRPSLIFDNSRGRVVGCVAVQLHAE